MKQITDIESLLQSTSAPKPGRGLRTGFTADILRQLAEPKPKETLWHRVKLLFTGRLAPVTVGLMTVFVLVSAGTTHALLKGWPTGFSFFSGESTETDGSRIVEVKTKDCLPSTTLLAFSHLPYNTDQESTYYFRVGKEAKFSNQEVVRMVQGYCELGRQTDFDQKTIIPALSQQQTNKDADIFGFYSGVIDHISDGRLTYTAQIPIYNQKDFALKTRQYTFAVDPAALVYFLDNPIRLQDLKPGDNISVKYRVPKQSTMSQEVSPDQLHTDGKVVIAIVKNPDNIIAALEFIKYRSHFSEVTPCNKTPSGYCTPEEYSQQIH